MLGAWGFPLRASVQRPTTIFRPSPSPYPSPSPSPSPFPFPSPSPCSLQCKSAALVRAKEEEEEEGWESMVVAQISPLILDTTRNRRAGRSARKTIPPALFEDEVEQSRGGEGEASQLGFEWSNRARKHALLSIESRGIPVSGDALFRPKKKDGKSSRRKKKTKLRVKKVGEAEMEEEIDSHSLSQSHSHSLPSQEDKEEKEKEAIVGTEKARKMQQMSYLNFFSEKLQFRNDLGAAMKRIHNQGLILGSEDLAVESSCEGIGEENENENEKENEKEKELSEEETSRKERGFNRRLVDAQDAQIVLEEVTRTNKLSESVGSPSLLSPFNVATALHRIARHMESAAMSKSERLAFARQSEMFKLVSSAMESLPACSPQGMSNIAWALSKVGGSLLYSSEMDYLAQVAISKTRELNAQNIANIAGSFASMQHPASPLFAELADHASSIVKNFRPQELAQTMWAFACLNENLDPFFKKLDYIVGKGESKELSYSLPVVESTGGALENKENTSSHLFMDSNEEQLANIAWSYAVLGQLERPSFAYIWKKLTSLLTQSMMNNDNSHCNERLVSQIYQVNLCLQLEHPQLALGLEGELQERVTKIWTRTKSTNIKSSAHQRDVRRLLANMGWNWVSEYTATDYSLDFALVERKIGLEIDGPSHFTRTTSLPLGHTVLKRRLLTKAGWTIVSMHYEEWENLDGESEQMDYVKSLLEAYI